MTWLMDVNEMASLLRTGIWVQIDCNINVFVGGGWRGESIFPPCGITLAGWTVHHLKALHNVEFLIPPPLGCIVESRGSLIDATS